METFSFKCIKLTGHKRVFDILMNNKATNLTKPEQHCDFQNTLRETTTRCMKPFEKRKKYIRHHGQQYLEDNSLKDFVLLYGSTCFKEMTFRIFWQV